MSSCQRETSRTANVATRATWSVSLAVIAVGAVIALAQWSKAQEESLPSQPGPATAPRNGQPRPNTPLPKTDARHYSYAIGLDIGSSFKQDDMKLEVESLLTGLRDGLAAAEPKYSRELCGLALQRLEMQRRAKLKRAADAFMENNRKGKGVQVTKSGLQYQILKQSESGTSPLATDRVLAHYEGSLIDGFVFDSTSGQRPAELPLQVLVPGMSEALQKMQVGDKWRLFIPEQLAYGAAGHPEVPIPPHAVLIFEIELLDILKAGPPEG